MDFIMALGRRTPQQPELFVATTQLVRVPGHPFYGKLNQVLSEADFDLFVEDLCAPHYKRGGRPGIPPGVYFRMILVGYFEGLDSQRGIAWRCADSLALREFLGYALTDPTPVHASLTEIRKRLPQEVFEAVFQFVLALLEGHGLLRGQTLGIDATTLEANAAMKSIVRRDTGEDWMEYLKRLALAEGIENPTPEDLRRLDRNRPDKKVSNQDWQSRSDPEARITKMKDGTTHLAYKAEHAVDLESEAIVAACVVSADTGDASSGPATLAAAQANLSAVQAEATVSEVVMDRGYHDNGLLSDCAEAGVRTYIAERKQASRRWTDKPPEQEAAFRANRRRVRGERGRRLSRRRSEVVERTFAHVCETGGGRRSWLRGLMNVAKLHLLRSAAYNLGLLLRKVWGMGKPRSWEAGWAAAMAAAAALLAASGRPGDEFDVLTTAMGVALAFLIVRRAFGPEFSLLSTESRKVRLF
jgi:transposase